MNKKLEFRYAGDEHDDDYFRLVYNNVSCGERIHRSRKAAIACSALVSDFATMQSELESLRAKCEAFDWLGLHLHHVRLSHTGLGGYKAWDTKGKQIAEGRTFMDLVSNVIAKHETDEIPDKGDTMETNSKMKLEIRQDSDFTAMQSELETLRAKERDDE